MAISSMDWCVGKVQDHWSLRLISTLGTIAEAVIKFGAPASFVFGATVMTAYLRSVGAPVPIGDAAAGLAFSFCAAFAGFLAMIIVFGLGAPIILELLPKKSDATPPQATAPAAMQAGTSFKQYLTHFAPFVVVVVISIGEQVAREVWAHTADQAFIVILLSFPIGLEVGYGVNRFDRKPDATADNLLAVMWLWLIWVNIISPALHHVFGASDPPATQGLSVAQLAALIAALPFHFIARRVKRNPASLMAVGGVLTMFVLFYLPGAGAIGAASLQFFGIGGGIPVTILFKPISEGSHFDEDGIQFVDRLNGCLILNVGAEVIVEPVTGIEKPNCKRDLPLLHTLPVKLTELRREDIIRITPIR